jgi:hypothetical protein
MATTARGASDRLVITSPDWLKWRELAQKTPECRDRQLGCAFPVVEENNWSKAICGVVGAPPGGVTLVTLASESTNVTGGPKVELLVALGDSVPVLVLGCTLIVPVALLPSHSSR